MKYNRKTKNCQNTDNVNEWKFNLKNTYSVQNNKDLQNRAVLQHEVVQLSVAVNILH